MAEIAAADIIGSIGVALLLAAFGLNLFGLLEQRHLVYPLMNFAGAGLATLASLMIDYLPFVLLEATWCVVSAAALVRLAHSPKPN